VNEGRVEGWPDQSVRERRRARKSKEEGDENEPSGVPSPRCC
jgi:hypothetical protein